MTGIIRKANLLSHSKWTITVKDREKEELPKRILPPLCVLDVLKRQGFWGSLLWVVWRLPRWYWQGGLYSKGDWPPVSRGEGLRGFTVWGHSWIFCSTPQGGWCQRSGFAAGCDRLNARWIKPKRKAGEKLPRSQVLSGRKFEMFTKFISLASKAPTTAHHPTTRYNDVKNDAKKKKVYIAKCMDKWIFQKTLKSRSKWVSCKM